MVRSRFLGFFGGCLLAVGVLAAGCGSGDVVYEDVPSGPAQVQYQIDFQNQPNVIGTTTVQILMFDASARADVAGRNKLCGELIALRKRGSPFRREDGYIQIGDSGLISPCEMTGGESAKGGLDGKGFGARALLVVGSNPAIGTGNSELFIGCGHGDVEAPDPDPGDAPAPIVVPMYLFDAITRSVPPSTCARLADRCAGTCQ